MNIKNRVISFILATLLVFSLVGCGDNTNASTAGNASSNSTESSNQENSSQSSSSQDGDFYQGSMDSLKDFGNEGTYDPHDPSYVGGGGSSVKDPHAPVEGTVSSGKSSSDKNSSSTNNGGSTTTGWSGPSGYVIVVPKGNASAKKSAELLKQYYYNANRVQLSIVTDDTAATSKEILVGKTNRSESNKNLAESKLQVSVKGSKLVFDGGHNVSVDTAVKRFINRQPLSNKVCTFSESIDFVSTKSGGYKYVWGDEFERQILDPNLWSNNSPKMSGGNVLILDSSQKTTSIVNGALKLTAFKDNNGKYHVPISVETQKTMNYQYGYVEMRAKLSLELGSFASFWTRSVSNVGSLVPGNYTTHFAEVDMFEVWNNKGVQMISAGIIKNFYPSSGISSWNPSVMQHAQQRIIPDEKYHVYGYEWTPTELNMYYDNELYARFDITSDWVDGPTKEGKGKPGWSINWYKETDPLRAGHFDKTGSGMGSFHEPHYLIFNHHLHHKDAFKASTSVTENANFKEADYIIDYVRLYQKDGQKLYTK